MSSLQLCLSSVCAGVLLSVLFVLSVHTASPNRAINLTVDLDDMLSKGQKSLARRNWAPSSPPAPLSRCKALVKLRLYEPEVNKLPPRWVSACPRLQDLMLNDTVNLRHLPKELLANATELTMFQISNSALEELPPDLFNYSPKLQIINLSWNSLVTLPRGIFERNSAMRKLYLSGNKLQPSAMEALTVPALQGLHRFYLDGNPTLHDFCNSSQDVSKLSSMRNLTFLSLERNNITIICRDWRTEMPWLHTLELRFTRISRLQRADLEFVREVDSAVFLAGTPVTSVQFNESDYLSKTSIPSSPVAVTVYLEPIIHCDCSIYWMWRVLREGRWPARARLGPQRCEGSVSRLLHELDEDELTCPDASTCGALPPGCTCRQRPAPGGSRHLRVSCAGANLTAVPSHMHRITDSVDLQLEDNNITSLLLDQLPPNFTKLDVSNNTLHELDVETAAGLVKDGRRVNISGNSWSCECGNSESLAVLREHFFAVEDYWAVECDNGSALMSLSLEPCPSPPQNVNNGSPSLAVVIGASLAVLLVVTCTGIACFMRRDMRLLAEALLNRAGLLPSDEHGSCTYDAFVSFSHEDGDRALEIVRWLESRSMPYRLCLHYRDWVPGRSIPEQISESVMGSRCTLALLSSSFLRSTWARAEFREAHAHAMRHARRRLLVVLLEERGKLDLDAELRYHLALNTYVQWGDPWFWEKLRRALPRPMPRDPSLPHHPTANPLAINNTTGQLVLEPTISGATSATTIQGSPLNSVATD